MIKGFSKIFLFINILLVTFVSIYSKEYKWNKVDNISISLPQDWSQEKRLDIYLNEILKFRHKRYKNFTIKVTYKRLVNIYSSRQYAHFDASVLKRKKYVILGKASTHVNLIPSYEYEYEYVNTLYNTFEKDFFIMRKIYIVIKRKYYSLIFSCPKLYYHEYQPILRKILDNFIIELKSGSTEF